jgi:ankyrin
MAVVAEPQERPRKVDFHELAKKFMEAEGFPTDGSHDGANLWIACFDGDFETVERLVKKGVKMDEAKDPVINIAAQFGFLDIVRFLVESGMSPDIMSKSGGTPLLVAAYGGHLETVQYLVSKGADVKKAGSGGWTPLHSAAHRNRTQVASFLIENGANVSAPDQTGKTPLHLAAACNNVQTLELLAGKGADLSALDVQGRTPLTYACMCAYIECVRRLIKFGADPGVPANIPNINSWDQLSSEHMPEIVNIFRGAGWHPPHYSNFDPLDTEFVSHRASQNSFP